MLGWFPPHREPFRRLLIHPVVVSRLNEVCGKGFRLDDEPVVIGAEQGAEERYGDWTKELTPEQHSLLYGPGHRTGNKKRFALESDGKAVWLVE